MLKESETQGNDNEVTFGNVYEAPINENTNGLNIPGNYWNRIDDYTKVHLVLLYSRKCFDFNCANITITDLPKGFGLEIIQNHTRSKPTAKDRVIGYIREADGLSIRTIKYGDKINPGGADSKYIYQFNLFPASHGPNSSFTMDRQSFRPNLQSSNGINYTDASGRYIPIRQRPNF